VVHDEVPVRTALRRLLRLAEYEVVEFESDEPFLASLARRVPACATIRVHMPGLSGFDVHLRLCAEHSDIPVVSSPRATIPPLDNIADKTHRSCESLSPEKSC
jgi:FixJ family two-component response regulator